MTEIGWIGGGAEAALPPRPKGRELSSCQGRGKPIRMGLLPPRRAWGATGTSHQPHTWSRPVMVQTMPGATAGEFRCLAAGIPPCRIQARVRKASAAGLSIPESGARGDGSKTPLGKHLPRGHRVYRVGIKHPPVVRKLCPEQDEALNKHRESSVGYGAAGC